MSRSEAVDLLRRYDPACSLEPLPRRQREDLRAGIVAVTVQSRSVRSLRRLRPVGLVVAVAAAAILGGGGAWAAGTWSPLAPFRASPQQLFETNPANDGSPGSLWRQHVVAGSVVEVTSLELPRVGSVGFWYGTTSEHGWCAGLRMPGGAWVGTGDDPLDDSGTVPGCSPTRPQINGSDPVYALNGFDYDEGDVDARSRGGAFWRIRYGLIDAPGVVRVADLVSGRSARVVDGDLFALAIPDPDPMGQTPVHLVAYSATGKIVADDGGQP